VEDGKSFREISVELEKSPEAVRAKIRRLGLEVVKHQPAGSCSSTSNVVLPEKLISAEDALKMLSVALPWSSSDPLKHSEVAPGKLLQDPLRRVSISSLITVYC
jgi:hypothetical protein